jgi:large subunit ribosomal protein L46
LFYLGWKKIMFRPVALLPEGYVPAPRETEADMTGNVRTLDRKLKTRVFLTVQEDGEDAAWKLPTVPLKKDEKLLDAAKRAIVDQAGGAKIELYCPSNTPVGVHLTVFPEEARTEGFFGTKTFFMRLQYDEGNVSKKDMAVKDYAWLDRDEIVERVLASQGAGPSKFYRYVL